MDMGASPSPVASSAPPVRVFVADVNTYVSNHVARAFANQGYAVYGSLQQLDPATRAFQSVTSRSVLSAPEQTPPGSRGHVHTHHGYRHAQHHHFHLHHHKLAFMRAFWNADDPKAVFAAANADIVVFNLNKHKGLQGRAIAQIMAEWADAQLELPTDRQAKRPKVLIGITTPLTWGGTTFPEGVLVPPTYPTSEEEEGFDPLFVPGLLKLTEQQLAMRRPLPAVFHTVEAEDVVLRAHRRNLLSTAVVCPGVMYGEGEITPGFQAAMRAAFEIKPTTVFGDGENTLPTVHCTHFGKCVVKVAENGLVRGPELPGVSELLARPQTKAPRQQYFIATDPTVSTQRELMTAISSALGDGKVEHIPAEQVVLNTTPENADIMTLNLPLVPSAALPTAEDALDGMISRMKSVADEFVNRRGVTPLRVVLFGPPGSNKLLVALKLAKRYSLMLITHDSIKQEAKALREYYDEVVPDDEDAPAPPPPPPLAEEEEKLKARCDAVGDGELPWSLEISLFRRVAGKLYARNRGYVVVGWPETALAAKSLFMNLIPVEPPPNEDGEEEPAAPAEEGEKDLPEEDPEEEDSDQEEGGGNDQAAEEDAPPPPPPPEYERDPTFPTHFVMVDEKDDSILERCTSLSSNVPKHVAELEEHADGLKVPELDNFLPDSLQEKLTAWREARGDEQGRADRAEARRLRREAREREQREKEEAERMGTAPAPEPEEEANEAAAEDEAKADNDEEKEPEAEESPPPPPVPSGMHAFFVEHGVPVFHVPEIPVPYLENLGGAQPPTANAEEEANNDGEMSPGSKKKKKAELYKEVLTKAREDALFRANAVQGFLGHVHNFDGFQSDPLYADEEEERLRLLEEEARRRQAEEELLNRESAEKARREALTAEQKKDAAGRFNGQLELRGMPLRGFLCAEVLPQVTEGMLKLCEHKPSNPIKVLAEHLIEAANELEAAYVDNYVARDRTLAAKGDPIFYRGKETEGFDPPPALKKKFGL